MAANDHQVGGTHYQSDFQHWDFVVQFLDNHYLEGQITKYLSRWRKKGQAKLDLEKSLHYMDKLVEEARSMRVFPLGGLVQTIGMFEARQGAIQFCMANDLNAVETGIITDLTGWAGNDELLRIQLVLATYVAKQNVDGQFRPFGFDPDLDTLPVAHDGNIFLRSVEDAAKYQDVAQINGDLYIQAAVPVQVGLSVTLPSLKRVTGAIFVAEGGTLNAPLLTAVQGSIFTYFGATINAPLLVRR